MIKGIKNITLRPYDPVNPSTWWVHRELEMAAGNNVFRAQSNYAYASIFGWVEVINIGKHNAVKAFLTKGMLKRGMLKRLGCGDMTKEGYIKKWCDGDENKIVRPISFVFHMLSTYADFVYAASLLEKAVASRIAEGDANARGRKSEHLMFQNATNPCKILLLKSLVF